MGKRFAKRWEGNITIRIMNQRKALHKENKIARNNAKKGGSLEGSCWAGCSVTPCIQHFLNDQEPTHIQPSAQKAKWSDTTRHSILGREVMASVARLGGMQWDKKQGQVRKSRQGLPVLDGNLKMETPAWFRSDHGAPWHCSCKRASTNQNISKTMSCQWGKISDIRPATL